MEANKGNGEASKYAIGIDLGTTYSCVGVWKQNRVEIITNDMGNRTTPSYVAFSDEERLVGDAALNQASRNPENTVFDAKRMIGRRWSDEEVQKDIRHWPFKVVQREGDKPFIQVQFQGETRDFAPEEISSMVLGKMKASADAYLGGDVKSAVITVPAYFNDAQRVATKQAGTIAGLDVLRIINEPTSAAIAYGLERMEAKKSSGASNEETTILVFDYGGGTLDVSILNLAGGVFEVKATGGDTHLGGEDLDNILVAHFANEFKRKNNTDMTVNQRALRRLRTSCEKAKRTLSSNIQATVDLDTLFEGKDFASTITRARFEELCADDFRKCLKIVIKVLEDAKMDKKNIDEVVLVGGSSRIPKIVELLEGFFQGKKVNKSINPDEAVAYGAAVQAGILTNNIKKGDAADQILLLDVIPLNMGIETQGGAMAVVLPRNTTIPTTQKKIFSTSRDNQDFVDIKVYEGERPNVRDCNLLGKFTLSGIPPSKRAVPQIEVKFDVDANGILSVSAEELTSKSKGQITITSDKGRLSAEEVQKMLKDAETFAARDKELLEITDWMNSIENFAFNIKDTIQNGSLADNLDSADKEVLGKLAVDLLAWVESNPKTQMNLEDVKAKRKEAESIYNPIITKVYNKIGHTVDPEYEKQQAQQQQQQQDQAQQEGGGGEGHEGHGH